MKRSWMSRSRAGHPVDEILALARAEEAARNGDFAVSLGWSFGRASIHGMRFVGDVLAVNLRVHQGHGDVGHAKRLAIAGAREDHVFHASAAQAFGGLLTQYPTDCIADVGLPAAVGPDDAGNALAGEAKLGTLAKGLESLQFDAF